MNYAKDIHFLADSEIKETKVTLEYLSPNKLGCKIESTRQTLKDHVTVQWMHNGRHMHYETLMIGNKTTSEARFRSSHDNNGSSWYQCIVRNGLRVLGMASVSKLVSREKFESPLALPLKQTEQAASSQRSPYFIYISPDQRISVGGSTKLKCIAGGNPLPRLEWRLNGKVLVWSYQDLWCVDFYFQHKNLQPLSMRSIQDGNESRAEYLLEGVTSTASGLYSCTAENIFGEAESSVRIDVDGRPFIREMTSPRRLLGGSLHEWLHCSYGGFPIDKVTWDKDGECFDTNRLCPQ